MKRLAVVVVLAAVLLPACGGTDRPEGVVERWLISLNQGSAGQPQKYAPERLSQRILPNWASRDPGNLDVIEVGRGRTYLTTQVSLDPEHALVPYRVKMVSGPVGSGIVILHKRPAGWRVFALEPSAANLSVPSKGGQRIGRASPGVWLIGLGVAVALILVSIGLMSTVGRERPVPAR